MFGRGVVGVGFFLVSGFLEIDGAQDEPRNERPAASKSTPTIEEGMPLFSSDEITFLFDGLEQQKRREHPIFVGMEDDIVELETFNIYSDKITLRQSLEERMSEAGWQAMMARLESLDPKLTSQAQYDKRSSDRFFSSQMSGGVADRPNPGGISLGTALDSTLKAFHQVFGP
jgi:hypothetical protein